MRAQGFVVGSPGSLVGLQELNPHLNILGRLKAGKETGSKLLSK